MKKRKPEVITFKVEESLLEAMKGVENRSEFIRTAILAALENQCPMCSGTGVLSPNKKRHWEALAKDHFVEECERCNEVRIVCGRTSRKKASKKSC